jgi:tryptophan-rich sensory protein
MLQGKKLAAIAIIVALFTVDLVAVCASHGPVQSWPALLPYLLTWVVIAGLSVYTVLKDNWTAH